MLSTAAIKLSEFRHAIYACFHKRSDANMNLLDALSCQGRQCDSVVQLSTSPLFERKYSSITDAIADGLPGTNWNILQRLAYKQRNNVDNEPHRFIIDCTANSRMHAKTLEDRHVTHYPNPAPGNKPICIGHQYSVLTSLPNEETDKQKHWLLPLSAVRVKSSQKGNEIGMTQVTDAIKSLDLTDKLSISVGDSLYGTENCRMTAISEENLIHIFRLNSKRNVFFAPVNASGEVSKSGRKKEYGDKMNLSDPKTQPSSDQSTTTEWVNHSGKKYKVIINAWNDMLLRGSRKFRSSQHPLNVIRIEVFDEEGKRLYKRPLWLGILGKRRHEMSLTDAYENYRSRYNIEHFFRFSKRNLLIDKYQTADVEHEERWWSLCLLAYTQLYLAKSIVPLLPRPWERYLPSYQNTENQEEKTTTPSQTQRGFFDILQTIGTPARTSVVRGKPRGRTAGDIQVKRPAHPVIFKDKKPDKKSTKNILLGSGTTRPFSDPKKIDDLVQFVQTSLDKLNIRPSVFSDMLIDST